MDEVDALLADLARWTGDRAMATAAQSRARERWLRQQAAEDARFAGVLVDLAEQATPVVLTTTMGTVVRGRVVAVGADFAMVAAALAALGTAATFVRLDAVATVRPEPGRRSGDAAAERSGPTGAGLADVLSGLAADRPRVTVVTAGAAGGVTGELRAVGADVVTVRLDGHPPPTVYVRSGAICQLTVL